MIKILLDIASNGVIKTVTDNNINGAGDIFERKNVYNFEDDESFEKRIQFLYELCEEIGIETGNTYDKDTLIFTVEWGVNYTPVLQEVNNRIKEISSVLKELKILKAKLDNASKKI